jgi:phage terminase large subunit GpA-like protein
MSRRTLTSLIKHSLNFLKPPDPLTLSEWADKNRRISKESNPEPGRWHTEPYQKEPFDTFTRPDVREMVVMSASQMIKTELALNALAFYAEHDPSPCLYVAPNVDPMAKSFSIERLAPMIRDTPALVPLFADHRSRDSGNKVLHKTFPGGFWALTGANSPAGLAMRPIRILILDEVDRYPTSSGKEGNPIEIARARTKRFPNRKILILSSPTTEEGNINIAYLNSDQRVCEVPCLLCGHYQELEWENLKFNIRDAFEPIIYECKFCSKAIEEKHKFEMVENGRWRATKPDNLIPGFLLSELVSIRRSWVELVEQFRRSYLQAKAGNIEDLKVFYNTVLTRTFEDRLEAPDYLHIFARRERYARNVVPKGGLFLTGAVDVQADRVEVEIRAWGRSGVSWSVDYRVFYFDPSVLENYKILESSLLNVRWPVEGSSTLLPLRALGVDTGGSYTQVVYMWCRRQNLDIVKALKGGPASQKAIISPPSPVDIDYKGQKIKEGLNLWLINVSVLKNELYYRLQLNPNEDGTFPAGYMHFPDYGEEYFQQLVSESQIEKPSGKIEWVKHGANEALDLAVYNRALSILLGMDYLTEEGWQQLEQNLLDSIPQGSIINKSLVRQVKKIDLG